MKKTLKELVYKSYFSNPQSFLDVSDILRALNVNDARSNETLIDESSVNAYLDDLAGAGVLRKFDDSRYQFKL
jgi:hypothetical protein